MKFDSALSWLAALLLAACFACDAGKSEVNVMLQSPGDDPGTGNPDPGEQPPPASMAGTWDTTTVEVLDTCGFDPLPPEAALLIEEAQTSVIFSYVDPLGYCERSVRDRDDNQVSVSRTDTFEACGGMVRVQSNVVYEFGADDFTGVGEYFYTNVTGQCSNLPCVYRTAVAGRRCETCWPGCADGAGTRPEPVASSGVGDSGRTDPVLRLDASPAL